MYVWFQENEKLKLLSSITTFYILVETLNAFFQMWHPAQVLIQGNTKKPGRSLVFNNRVANINGMQRTNKPSFRKQDYLAFGMWSK